MYLLVLWCIVLQLEEYFRKQKYPEEYPSSSTPSPEGDQDDDDDGVSNNPLDRTFKSSITTEDTSDEDFDAGRYSTPQGRKASSLWCGNNSDFTINLIGIGAQQAIDTQETQSSAC